MVFFRPRITAAIVSESGKTRAFYGLCLRLLKFIPIHFSPPIRSLKHIIFLGCLGLLLCSFAAPVHAWRWNQWHLRLHIQLSSGWDDNVRRLTIQPQPESFPTWRRLTSGEPIQSRLPPASISSDGFHQISLLSRLTFRSSAHYWLTNYGVGAKHFFLTTDEDTLIQRADTLYLYRLHPRILIGAQIQAADRRRSNVSREYSLLHGGLRMVWLAPLGLQFALQAGYSLFDYRHFESLNEAHIEGFSDGQRYSYHGDFYLLSIQKQITRSFRINGSYQFARLFQQIQRTYTAESTCGLTTLSPRTDMLHRASVGFRFLYFVLVDGSYHLDALHANSCGESYLGHRFQLTFAVQAFWQLYLVVQGQLQIRTYGDGSPLTPSPAQTPEDDHLTGITIRLSRPIWKHLHINLRYSYYANLLGDGIHQYSRNLLTIGLSLLWQ